MNKYQEALDYIKEELPFTSGVIEERIAVIQKLVDKETPMKPRYRPSGNIKCGCGLQMYEEQQDWYRYCSSCGQKIDWRDEE